jgi:DNA repair photolyase
LEKDATKFAGDPRSILLSFTSDPYQPCEVNERLTRRALEILLTPMLGLKLDVLTKGGARAIRDFDLLAGSKGRASFASTLTFINGNDSLEWEPLAALPRDRLDTLEEAHRLGIPTWASLEPVVDPAQSLEMIRLGHSFVDQFKVGKLNHFREIEAGIDWVNFRDQAERLLQFYGFKRRFRPHGVETKGTYYLKADLVRATDHAFRSKTAA